ncbi:MAG: AzlC family ABC transporter permease [Firmicutes bacterium]|nr:AzlC family ABC transporter permease [Bacillota bacterium]
MNDKNVRSTVIRRAFKDTIPVMSGYLVLGIGFGVVLASRGYGVFWAMAMSVFIFAGSMQYVAIDLITGGVGLVATALTTLAVNARHLFYGLSMIEKYKGTKKKPFLIFALTDETYSLVCNDAAIRDVEDKNGYYFWVSLLDYSYWVTGSVLGSLIGAVIPFDMTGVDFSLTALFLTVFVEQWLSTKNHLAAITGVAASVICLVIFGSDNFLIPAMILITFALMMMRGREGITND